MNRTQVLLMCRELGYGGTERQLAETALGLGREGFEAHVGVFRASGFRADELRRAGVPVIEFPVHSFKSFSTASGASRLVKYIREGGIKLVHAFDVPLDVFAVPVTRLFTRAVALASQRGHRDLVPERSQRLLLKVSDRLAHGTVVNCEYMKRHLVEDAGVTGSRIRVCYNGVDLERFRRPDGARSGSEALGLPPGVTVIGTMCALRPEKGLPFLLEAFSRIEHRGAARLLIVGEGSEKEALMARARALGIQENCIFQPGAADVEKWLWAMDVFVLPSLTEAFSNSLMEAMAAGCAVLSTSVGGTPELIVHGESGWLFPPGDAAPLSEALESVLADSSLRKRLALGAGQRIQQFSSAASARQMARIYREYLAMQTA